MTTETKREILKACHYGFTHSEIAANCDCTEDEVRAIIEENLDALEELKELEAKCYGN